MEIIIELIKSISELGVLGFVYLTVLIAEWIYDVLNFLASKAFSLKDFISGLSQDEPDYFEFTMEENIVGPCQIDCAMDFGGSLDF